MGQNEPEIVNHSKINIPSYKTTLNESGRNHSEMVNDSYLVNATSREYLVKKKSSTSFSNNTH